MAWPAACLYLTMSAFAPVIGRRMASIGRKADSPDCSHVAKFPRIAILPSSGLENRWSQP
jgi:hypothetical protein